MPMRSGSSGGVSLAHTAARAHELASRPYEGGRGAPPRAPARVRVVGDPQASLERFLEVLAAHDLLGTDGYLADDVQLVSIGDHFDYRVHDASDPRRDGAAILRWLAEHHPSQAPILLGNHDAARVMELIGMSDERFGRAQAAARRLAPLERSAPDEYARQLRDEFAPAFPDVPTPGLVARDYASYGENQRDLVISLLLAGRFRLAATGRLPDDRTALLTHAGVSSREVDLLGAGSAPLELADALNRRLAAAVNARRSSWRSGQLLPLELEPLHHAGAQPHEGGGLLYHRPSNPDREPTAADRVDPRWETGPRRRRFHPRELPAGLVQIAGHTPHRKCLSELGRWVAPDAAAMPHGSLRTLLVEGDRVTYRAGVHDAARTSAVMLMIDAEMNEGGESGEEVALLALLAPVS